VTVLSQFMASSLVPGDGHGEMPLPDLHASQPPLLAPPQHA